MVAYSVTERVNYCKRMENCEFFRRVTHAQGMCLGRSVSMEKSCFADGQIASLFSEATMRVDRSLRCMGSMVSCLPFRVFQVAIKSESLLRKAGNSSL